jgi:uncharacterized protein (DUF4415 family)
MLDGDLLMAFRAKTELQGTGYQTLINQSLRPAAATRQRVGSSRQAQ